MKYSEDQVNKETGYIDILWRRFSKVQCAEYLVVDKDSLDRFNLWIETGNDNDAWS